LRAHEEPTQLRKRGDDVLADAVGEIFLRAIAAHVGERQHGDAGPVERCGLFERPRHRRRRGFFRVGLHGADETKALAGDGADEGLLAAAVANGLAGGIDSAGQRRLRDMPPMPDLLDQLFLAHHAIAVFHQMDHQIEHLRLQRDRQILPAQLPRVGIKHLI
jgi:hypothetical protein